MKRFMALALSLAFSGAALAQVPYRWSSPLKSPAGTPPPAQWRSPYAPPPGAAQPSRADEDKVRRQMAADGARPWHGLDDAFVRVRNALPRRTGS